MTYSRTITRLPATSIKDWSLLFVTGHRVRVVLYTILCIATLYIVQDLLWSDIKTAQTISQNIWELGSLLWLGAVIPGTCGLIGLLAFKHPQHLDTVKPIAKLVSWRIVSRGTNVAALKATIMRCQKEMSKTPLFPYIIEVVTDIANKEFPPPDDTLTYIIVPHGYKSENNSLYKARALQYATLHSKLPHDAWIVHLDEETQPTPSGIKGICEMIAEEEHSGQLRIGQGAILYHRNWKKHPILTLADNVRTGDDFARFYFQHKLGITIFGLHGSYIVVRNDIEKAIGFDFGPKGSITEDAFWALVAMEQGHRCRWVNGYLEEQSTQSFIDFIKQRRRWFQGLALVSVYAPVKIHWRLSLGWNTILWAIAPFASLYTIANFFYGFEINPIIRFLANYSFTTFALLYIVGLKTNLDEHGITNIFRRLGWYIAQIILLPIFTFMESAGVLFAILKPVSGFHVVKK